MRTIVAVAMLAIFASGCSSTKTAQAGAPSMLKQGEVGPVITTVWGDLPSYKQPVAPQLKPARVPIDASKVYEGETIVDVLVGGDGTVHDVFLQQSGGNRELDQYFLKTFRTAVYPPMPVDRRSERFVVRQKMKINTEYRHTPDMYSAYNPAPGTGGAPGGSR